MENQNILVIDGQGGGIGRQLVEGLRAGLPNADITAIGTNSIAASAMLKAGATNAATGENAVIVACRSADIITGPIGIVIADSLMGEITTKMAFAIGQSNAKKILIPVNMCNNIIAGVTEFSVKQLIKSVIEQIVG